MWTSLYGVDNIDESGLLKFNTRISSSLLEKGSCNFIEWKVQAERNIVVNELS